MEQRYTRCTSILLRYEVIYLLTSFKKRKANVLKSVVDKDHLMRNLDVKFTNERYNEICQYKTISNM